MLSLSEFNNLILLILQLNILHRVIKLENGLTATLISTLNVDKKEEAKKIILDNILVSKKFKNHEKNSNLTCKKIL